MCVCVCVFLQRLAKQEELTKAARLAMESSENSLREKKEELLIAQKELSDMKTVVHDQSARISRLETKINKSDGIIRDKNDILRKQVRNNIYNVVIKYNNSFLFCLLEWE